MSVMSVLYSYTRSLVYGVVLGLCVGCFHGELDGVGAICAPLSPLDQALHVLASCGASSVEEALCRFKTLIKKGADITSQDGKGRNVCHVLADSNRLATAGVVSVQEALFEGIFKKSSLFFLTKKTSLLFSTRNKNGVKYADTVTLLTQQNEWGETPLSAAARTGNFRMIAILLAQPELQICILGTGCKLPSEKLEQYMVQKMVQEQYKHIVPIFKALQQLEIDELRRRYTRLSPTAY